MEDGIDAVGPKDQVAVHCRGVTKTYGTGDARVMALRGIDLDVRRGELLMVVGPSGCGKTTLISVIAGILDQDSGQCEVLGRDLKHVGRRERARFRGLSIGFVFQLFNLLPALNAVENVSVPLLIVCDEPTSNLDHVTGRSMMELLRDVAKSPERALIVVTHDPRIFEFADRVARMDDGKIIEILESNKKERLQ